MEQLHELPVEFVGPNPDQPRKVFDLEGLRELAASIEGSGLQNPIVVREVSHWDRLDGAHYEIVSGERRWRAFKLLGRERITGRVVEMDDTQRDIAAISENLARRDVSPMEEAWAFRRLLDRGVTLADLAQRIGLKDAMRVSSRLQLLGLLPDLQRMAAHRQIPETVALALSRVADHERQRHLFHAYRGGRCNAEQLRGVVDDIAHREAQGALLAPPPELTEAERKALAGLERRTDQLAKLCAAGFDRHEGLDVLKRVEPERARPMADKLDLIRRHLGLMAAKLREGAVQRELLP